MTASDGAVRFSSSRFPCACASRTPYSETIQNIRATHYTMIPPFESKVKDGEKEVMKVMNERTNRRHTLAELFVRGWEE